MVEADHFMTVIREVDINVFGADEYLQPGNRFFFDVMEDDKGQFVLAPKIVYNFDLAEIERKYYPHAKHVGRWHVKMKEQPKGGEVWQ